MILSIRNCSCSLSLYPLRWASLVMLLGISMQQAQAQESPLQCVLRGQSVSCDVTRDEINIENIVLNRGRCEWSAPTEEDRQSAAAFRNTFPEQVWPVLLPQMTMLTQISGCKSDMPDFPIDRCKAAVAFVKVMNDPTGAHMFGDKVQFSTSGCDNLLEYTITVDGTDWTWSTR